MSYRVGTTNFNLPQTEGTDKRDWSDTNQAFADLDAAVGQAGTDASQALTLATTAQTTADGAVTTAQGAVTTANAASATATSASEAAALARTEAQSASTVAGQANTTAQAAQTTASNADTVALAAQANIGTMANLQTTDKTSLVAAINEVLSQIGGIGMKTLTGTVIIPAASTGSATVDISTLGLSSADDYFILLDAPVTAMPTGSAAVGGIGGVCFDNKTATSFSVNHGSFSLSNDITVTYQVVYNQ